MRKNPTRDGKVEIGERLFGDAGGLPQYAFRMGETRLLHRLPTLGFWRLLFEDDLGRVSILAQSLERCLAQQFIARPAAVLYLCHELRVDPTDILGHRARQLLTKVRVGTASPVELPPKSLGLIERKSGARAPGVHEAALVVVPKHERTHRAWKSRGWNITDDHELLAQHTFGFDPVFAAAGHIGQIDALGNDPLESEPAGMGEHLAAIALDVIAELHDGCFGQRLENLAQQLAAPVEANGSQIAALAIENIESEKRHPVAPAGFQIRLQRTEACKATFILHDGFAVDESGADGQQRKFPSNGRKAAGPVETVARQQLHAPAIDTCLHAVTIELDLVHPVLSTGRVLFQQRETG